MAMPTDKLADAVVKMVTDAAGQKKFKAMDIQKAMVEAYGSQGVDKNTVKEVIKDCVNTGRLVYTYYGGSFIEIPHVEGSANA